jgi:hypothetical protein
VKVDLHVAIEFEMNIWGISNLSDKCDYYFNKNQSKVINKENPN